MYMVKRNRWRWRIVGIYRQKKGDSETVMRREMINYDFIILKES